MSEFLYTSLTYFEKKLKQAAHCKCIVLSEKCNQHERKTAWLQHLHVKVYQYGFIWLKTFHVYKTNCALTDYFCNASVLNLIIFENLLVCNIIVTYTLSPHMEFNYWPLSNNHWHSTISLRELDSRGHV